MTMLTDFIPVGAPIVTPPGTGTTSCWIIKYLNTDTNKNIRHRQRDNILCSRHQCLLHSVSAPELWMFGFPLFPFSFHQRFLFVPDYQFNRFRSITNCAKFDPIFSKRKYIHGHGQSWKPTIWLFSDKIVPVTASRHHSRETWAPMCCNSSCSMFSPNE